MLGTAECPGTQPYENLHFAYSRTGDQPGLPGSGDSNFDGIVNVKGDLLS